MRLTAPKSELLQAIQAVAKAIPSASAEPMLQDVLFEAEASGLQAFATDNRISIRQKFKGEVADTGSIAIPGALFAELVSSLASVQVQDVRIETNDRFRVSIECGDAQYEIGGHDPKGFPYIPPFEGEQRFTIPSAELKTLLRQVTIVAGSGFQGATFEEVAVESEEGLLTFVSTDSVRLAIRKWKSGGTKLPSLDIRVPMHALQELAKVLGSDGETTVQVGEDAIAFHFGGTEFRARLSERAFPNYRQILPTSHALKATIDVRAFSDAVKGVLPLAKEMKQKVHLKVDPQGMVEVLCVSPEIGKARRQLPATVEGKMLELAFNARFLLDYLSAVSTEKVELYATSSVHPAKLQPAGAGDEYVYLLMPINL